MAHLLPNVVVLIALSAACKSTNTEPSKSMDGRKSESTPIKVEKAPTQIQNASAAIQLRGPLDTIGSWTKQLDGKYKLVNESKSEGVIQVYDWRTKVQSNGGGTQASRGWFLVATLKPGESVTKDCSSEHKFDVPGWNHVTASDNDFGPSACWGTKYGEPAHVWLSCEKQ